MFLKVSTWSWVFGLLAVLFRPLVVDVGQLRLCCQFFEECGQQQWSPAGPGWCYYSRLFWCESLCTYRRPRLWCELSSCSVLLVASFTCTSSYKRTTDHTLCLCQRLMCVLTMETTSLSCDKIVFHVCGVSLILMICSWMDGCVRLIFGWRFYFLKEFSIPSILIICMVFNIKINLCISEFVHVLKAGWSSCEYCFGCCFLVRLCQDKSSYKCWADFLPSSVSWSSWLLYCPSFVLTVIYLSQQVEDRDYLEKVS